jgi:hypothetical protein
MPARLVVQLPDQPARSHVLAEGVSCVLGRGADCDLTVDHHSVSRRHARLDCGADGIWTIADLGSKNGLRVDGHRVERAALARAQWFALGDVFFEFTPLSERELEQSAGRQEVRRQQSQAWAERLATATDRERLLADLLQAIVELADARRGFLLTGHNARDLVLRTAIGLDPDGIAASSFQGSRGAVERAVRECRPVFLSNPADHWLQQQASVVAHGIRALAALPLLHAGELLGVAYVDTDDAARLFTELDVELLTAFAAQAAQALAATQVEERLADLERAVGGSRTAWSRLQSPPESAR